MRTIRVRFSKGGPALYVSHLDLSKVMMRAVVRSGLPIYYTEGFNPIPKMVFATPLSLGCGGDAEILDLRLMQDVSNEKIKARLSDVMPAGIEIHDVYTAKTKPSDAAYAENEITWVHGCYTDETCAAIEEYFRHPVIMMKKSKSGEKEVDVTDFVRSLTARIENDCLIVNAVCNANQENYLNPSYIVTAIDQKFHVTGENGYHTICRKRLLCEDGVTDFR